MKIAIFASFGSVNSRKKQHFIDILIHLVGIVFRTLQQNINCYTVAIIISIKHESFYQIHDSNAFVYQNPYVHTVFHYVLIVLVLVVAIEVNQGLCLNRNALPVLLNNLHVMVKVFQMSIEDVNFQRYQTTILPNSQQVLHNSMPCDSLKIP